MASQEILAPKVVESQALRLLGRKAASHQLAIAVLEMLRQVVDDLSLSGGRHTER